MILKSLNNPTVYIDLYKGETITLKNWTDSSQKVPLPMIYLTFKTTTQLQLRAYIYQARDLLPMDEDRFSGIAISNHIKI